MTFTSWRKRMADNVLCSAHEARAIAVLALSAMLALTGVAWSATGDISTFAGGGNNSGATALDGAISGPWNIFVDVNDNIWIADWRDAKFLKVDAATGVMTVVAGDGDYVQSTEPVATERSIGSRQNITADSQGNVYYRDFTVGKLARVAPDGSVTHVEGSESGRPAIDAHDNIYFTSGNGLVKIDGVTGEKSYVAGAPFMNAMSSAARGADGTLYFCATWQHKIFQVTPNGILKDFAGDGFLTDPDNQDWSGRYAGDGGAATDASLNYPSDIAVGSDGSVYITDNNNYVIRKVDASGIITTVAGTGTAGLSGNGGPATDAQLQAVSSVALDSSDNIYIADSFNNQVRKIDAAAGTIDVFVGSATGGGGDNGDGGPASDATSNFPTGVAVDGDGNVYIANFRNVRRVDATTGTIDIVAGDLNDSGFSGDGGPATDALLGFESRQIDVDDAGNVYLTDRANNRIRMVDAAGTISTVAGTGDHAFAGDGGPAIDASFTRIEDVSVDTDGNLLVSDFEAVKVRKIDLSTGTVGSIAGKVDSEINDVPAVQSSVSAQGLYVAPNGDVYLVDGGVNTRKIDGQTGIITRIAGDGTSSRGFTGDGGPATEAKFNRVRDVWADADGNVYLADAFNSRIRRVDGQTGIVTTFAGGGTVNGRASDGLPATEARLRVSIGVGGDSNGNIYIGDRGNGLVRKVDPATGIITTVAGGSPIDGGPATEAGLREPGDLFQAADGSVYITENATIRRVDAAGTITTVVGNGASGTDGVGGPATSAQLAECEGVFVDTNGDIYIADGPRILRVDAGTGLLEHIAGDTAAVGVGDGGGAMAAGFYATDLFKDGAGDLLFVDQSNNRVRKIDSGGVVTTIAGSTRGFGGDGGPATDAMFDRPRSIWVDADGNVFVTDRWNHRVRKIDGTTGTISTVAGSGSDGSTGEGGPATDANIGQPMGVSVDADGNIFIAEFRERPGSSVWKINASTGLAERIGGDGGNRNRGFHGDGGPGNGSWMFTPLDALADDAGNVLVADYGNNRVRSIEAVASPTTVNPGIYQGPATPPLQTVETGSNVASAPVDATTGASPVTLNFPQITGGGVTSLITTEEGPAPPTGFQLGGDPIFLDIKTTAAFSGPVELCVNYSGFNVSNEDSLRFFHYNDADSVWTDITTSLDTANDILCGETTSFSTFAVFAPKPVLAITSINQVANVNVTVTDAGVPQSGLTVMFSRSVTALGNDFLWEATTGSDGAGSVEIVETRSNFKQRGATGMYSVKAMSGDSVVGSWSSVPINGGKVNDVTLPIGGRAEVVVSGSLEGQIDFGLASFPNPFNPATQISYALSDAGSVSLVIYSVTGQQIQTLVNEQQSPGRYSVTWDGRNDFGRSVSSGIYLYRLTQNGRSMTNRMMLLK